MAFQGTLTGNLGMKPELKIFNSGKRKTELRVEVRQQDKDAPAFWVQVDLWDKSAEYAANYLDKGDSIFAQGTIKEEFFTRRNGEAGHKIVLQYARIELFKNNKDKETVVVPTPQPAVNPTPATQDDQVMREEHDNRKAGIYPDKTTYNSNDPVVPEVDEIPF